MSYSPRSARRRAGAGDWPFAQRFAILCGMTLQDIIESDEYHSLVDDYSRSCLWFAEESLVRRPMTDDQLEVVLSSIEANGDAEAYKRAGKIRQWL